MKQHCMGGAEMPDLPRVLALTIHAEFFNKIAYGHSSQIPTHFSHTEVI